jgi:hypothetical protein
MCKASVILREIVFKHHPDFNRRSAARRLAERSPGIFRVERLVEETMALVGGYKFIDGHHEDCNDGTEIKTASVYIFENQKSKTSFLGEVSNVRSPGGIDKTGALRVVIYNPANKQGEELRYYFLPKYMWEDDITVHPTSNVGKIRFNYHLITDKIKKFEDGRCETFEQLATRPANWKYSDLFKK